MAKILESASISGAVQKIVETKTGYIINGVFYDKAQLIPKPLKFYQTMGDHTALSMNKKLILKNTLTNHGVTVGDTVISDRYDGTITYVFTVNMKGNTHSLIKLKEINGSCEVVNQLVYGAAPAASPLVRAYCGQDEKFLYYLMSCAASYTESIVKIDKMSLAMTVVENFGTYSWGNPIKETDSFIYFARKNSYGTTIIKRYSKIKGTSEDMKATPNTSNINFSTCFSGLLSESETKFDTFAMFHNRTDGKHEIIKYSFDLAETEIANIITEQSMEIIWNDEVKQLPVFASNSNFHYELFLTDFNGKDYLNIAVYENLTSTEANVPVYGIYTFLINKTEKQLIFKDFLNLGSDVFRGFIGVKNNTFLALATDNATYFANFDAAEKFVVTDTLSNQPVHIGADESDNIWIVNGLNEVDMFSPFVANNINIKFEKDGYSFQGSDIGTYIEVEAKNFLGLNIKSNLQLSIKGNAIFSANGTKILTVSTSIDGVVQIPITIKDKGSLSIASQLLM